MIQIKGSKIICFPLFIFWNGTKYSSGSLNNRSRMRIFPFFCFSPLKL